MYSVWSQQLSHQTAAAAAAAAAAAPRSRLYNVYRLHTQYTLSASVPGSLSVCACVCGWVYRLVAMIAHCAYMYRKEREKEREGEKEREWRERKRT